MTDADLSDLRERAANGDQEATDQLVELAGERGDLGELRRLGANGSRDAADMVAELDEGQVDGNTRRAVSHPLRGRARRALDVTRSPLMAAGEQSLLTAEALGSGTEGAIDAPHGPAPRVPHERSQSA